MLGSMSILFHRDLGGEGLPPLIILHGLLGSSRNWQTAGRDLAKRAHVFALDARNHGQSFHAEAMSYEVMVTDTIAWMDEQGIRKATFLGHSMGGKTAMLLACRHPERVERLIVIDIVPKDYHWKSRPAEFEAMGAIDLESLPSRAEAEKYLETAVRSWTMRKFFVTNLERKPEGGWRWMINLPALTRTIHDLEKNQLEATDHFAGPTQFIFGGKSDYSSPEDYDLVQKHFIEARIETIAESGHNPHMETREVFVNLIKLSETTG